MCALFELPHRSFFFSFFFWCTSHFIIVECVFSSVQSQHPFYSWRFCNLKLRLVFQSIDAAVFLHIYLHLHLDIFCFVVANLPSYLVNVKCNPEQNNNELTQHISHKMKRAQEHCEWVLSYRYNRESKRTSWEGRLNGVFQLIPAQKATPLGLAFVKQF